MWSGNTAYNVLLTLVYSVDQQHYSDYNSQVFSHH